MLSHSSTIPGLPPAWPLFCLSRTVMGTSVRRKGAPLTRGAWFCPGRRPRATSTVHRFRCFLSSEELYEDLVLCQGTGCPDAQDGWAAIGAAQVLAVSVSTPGFGRKCCIGARVTRKN